MVVWHHVGEKVQAIHCTANATRGESACCLSVARTDRGDSETVIRQSRGRVVDEAPSLGVAVTGREGSASQLPQLVAIEKDELDPSEPGRQGFRVQPANLDEAIMILDGNRCEGSDLVDGCVKSGRDIFTPSILQVECLENCTAKRSVDRRLREIVVGCQDTVESCNCSSVLLSFLIRQKD